MAKYCGHDQKFIVSSLKRAEEFVRELDLGTETTEFLDKWQKDKPYEDIEHAYTDHDLVKTMNRTDSVTIFDPIYELLYAHALVDTDGVGRKVYEDLVNWGGFSKNVNIQKEKVEREMTTHLVDFYTDHIEFHFDPKTLITADQKNSSKLLAKMDKEYNAKTIGTALAVIKDGYRKEQLRPAQVREALHQLSNLESRKVELDIAPPIQAFGVVTGDATEAFSDIDTKARAFMIDLKEALKPFQELDEAEDRFISSTITEDQGTLGVLFFATERAAQAVMKALPEQQVINYQGEPVRARPPFPGGHRPKTPGMS